MNLSLKDKLWLLESYRKVLESRAQPNNFKNLTPEQAQKVAALSPSYVSKDIWGTTSAWLCSRANNLIKYQKKSFEEAFEQLSKIKSFIKDFEQLTKANAKDINNLKTLHELVDWVKQRKEETKYNLSPLAKKDGRVRQAYSLIRRGEETGDIGITYEDETWLIGYPTNFEYNARFGSVGEWCHTQDEAFFKKYALWPIFYCINKQEGYVLCASFQEYSADEAIEPGENEIRDQEDYEPDGWWNNDWRTFWANKGLEKPMVDDIITICQEYEIPDMDFDIKSTIIERMENNYSIMKETIEEYGFVGCNKVVDFSRNKQAGLNSTIDVFVKDCYTFGNSKEYSSAEIWNMLKIATLYLSPHEEDILFIIKEFMNYQPFLDEYRDVRLKVSDKVLSIKDILELYVNKKENSNIDYSLLHETMTDLAYKISEWFGVKYIDYSIKGYTNAFSIEADGDNVYIIVDNDDIIDLAADNYVNEQKTNKLLFNDLPSMLRKLTDQPYFSFQIPRLSQFKDNVDELSLDEIDESIQNLIQIFEKGT